MNFDKGEIESKCDRNTFDLFHEFSETGDKLTFQRLYDAYFDTNTKLSINVPPELALNVSIQVLKLIEADSTNDEYWWCLTHLMSPNINKYAEVYLVLLRNSPIMSRLFHILADNLNNTDDENLYVYLVLLHKIIVNSYERQSILYEIEGQYVLRAVENVFQNIEILEDIYVIVSCFRVVASLADLYPEAIEQNDQRSILWFLNIGGICRINKMFMTIVSTTIEQEQQNGFNILIDFYIVYNSLLHLDTTGLDRELYCIDRNSAYRMNVAFYKLFTANTLMNKDLDLSISAWHSYTFYLQHYELVSVLQSLLLYKPPGKGANSALVVVVLKFIRQSGLNNSPVFEDSFMQVLQLWSNHFPSVAALLDDELPPDRDDKVRVCALPECNIDGKGLFNKMMKCGRCRSTYYCSVEHQKEHWKVHKQSCCKLTTTTTTGTTTTGTTIASI